MHILSLSNSLRGTQKGKLEFMMLFLGPSMRFSAFNLRQTSVGQVRLAPRKVQRSRKGDK